MEELLPWSAGKAEVLVQLNMTVTAGVISKSCVVAVVDSESSSHPVVNSESHVIKSGDNMPIFGRSMDQSPMDQSCNPPINSKE